MLLLLIKITMIIVIDKKRRTYFRILYLIKYVHLYFLQLPLKSSRLFSPVDFKREGVQGCHALLTSEICPLSKFRQTNVTK
jgi:hypothetical protein